VQRLWLQSMTPQAIRDGFTHLRSDEQMRPLADAARSRSEADWMVGINGTRAMTAFNSRDGGFFLTTVGRVQTPTLAVVVEREEKIRQFVSRNYWEVHASFQAQAGEYPAKWFDPAFKKPTGDAADPEQRADRVWTEAQAQQIADASRQQPARVSEESKPTTQASGLLYDLTSLQREANGRFGFCQNHAGAGAEPVRTPQGPDLPAYRQPCPARRLFAHGQADLRDACRQRHEPPGAPRADGAEQRLHQAHQARVRQRQGERPLCHHSHAASAQRPERGRAKAVRPGGAPLSGGVLSPGRVHRHHAHQHGGAQWSGLQVAFKTEGKVLVKPGWMAVYGKEAAEDVADAKEGDKGQNLVPVAPGETVHNTAADPKGLKTKPPARYSEATLLGAMEGAGKLIDDDELREAMQEKGLGTPATRASIIEGLIAEKYMLREGRELIPTAKAFQLMTLLRGLQVEELSRPELTGDWEHKLSLMERGQLSREAFMRDIADMTQRMVQKAKEYDRDTIPGDYATLPTPCPNCGGVVKENYRRFACTGADGHSDGCGFSFTKSPAGRTFETAEAAAFLRDRHIGPLDGFRSKAGWPFVAEMKLVFAEDDSNWKLEFDFGDDKKAEETGELVEFGEAENLGACPKCGSAVHEHGANYVCEKSVPTAAQPTPSCDFKSGKVILQQTVEPSKYANCWPPARPTCWTSSCPCAPAARSRPSWPGMRKRARWCSSSSPAPANSRRAKRLRLVPRAQPLRPRKWPARRQQQRSEQTIQSGKAGKVDFF
jgi:DNA topoisomerase-3